MPLLWNTLAIGGYLLALAGIALVIGLAVTRLDFLGGIGYRRYKR